MTNPLPKQNTRRYPDSEAPLRFGETRVFRTCDISDEMLAALMEARVDPRHDHLNALLGEEAEGEP